jgi:WD40 repeat protein
MQISLAAVLCFAGADFQRDVFPVLQKYCVGCHNPDDAKGGLDMSTHAALLAGGKTGKALIPGKATDSLMVQLAAGARKPKMPPKNNPTPTEVEWAVVVEWIAAGANPSNVAATTFTPFEIAKKHAKPPAVRAVEFSPDGATLAVARGTTVLLVETKSGYVVGELGPHAGPVTGARFLAGGKRLVSAGGHAGHAGDVRLWDVVNRKLVRSFDGHRDAVYGLDVSKDGRLIASAGYDRDIRLWETETGKRLHTLKGHNDAVYALALSPDGKLAASASGDRTVKLWSTASGDRLDTFSQPTQDQYTVAFSPDGRSVVAAGGDNRLRIWDLGPGAKEGANRLREARFVHEAPVLRVGFSSDGASLFSAAQDRLVKRWKWNPLSEVGVTPRLADWPNAAAFSPDGKTLAVGVHDGSVTLFDNRNGKLLRTLELKPAPPSAPVVEGIRPPGIERGKPNTLVVSGKHLKSAALQFDAKEVVVRSTTHATVGDKETLTIVVECPPHRPRGPIHATAKSAGGSAKTQRLEVDDLPQFEEREPNDALAAAQPLSGAADVWGAVDKPGDADVYAISARAGETLIADVLASPFGSKLDALVTIEDETGRTLSRLATNLEGRDDLVAAPIAKDGRYFVRISDSRLLGSPQHRYRVSIGALPVATGVYPLAVPHNRISRVEVGGFNLKTTQLEIPATTDKEVAVPFPDAMRVRTRSRLATSASPEVLELEPNDTAAAQAVRMSAPGVGNGRIDRPGDVDFFRFAAKADERWIVETEAARLGSPVDTKIDVLDADGRPVPRMLLQAVRDANIHFRHIDSQQLEIRTTNWTEMELNDYLYMNGEVGRYFRLPEGPDSGFLFYNRRGKRIAYFDTSSTAHALGDPIYIVEPKPVGAALTPSGLPVFTLNFANDDAGDRSLGADSRLTFAAPATGEYAIRVADSQARGGANYAYRLHVRRPKPSFQVEVSRKSFAVPAGSGQECIVVVERLDGFDGPIDLRLEGLPAGFRASAPTTVEAGHREAKIVVFADRDAKPPTPAAKLKLTASATIDGKPHVETLPDALAVSLGPKPKLTVKLDPPVLTIAPGETVPATLSVERNGFDDRINFDFANLPHGVFVDNIGLNGILIRPKETTRQVFVTARSWVAPTERTFFAAARAVGNQASAPITLKVQRRK